MAAVDNDDLESQVDLDKRLASLGHLSASVAHAFNNVLMSILPFAELLKRQYKEDERIRVATDQIANAVRRGRSISQEILRFARPARAALVPVNVAEWMTNVAREASALAGPNIDILIDAGDTEGHWIIADRRMIDQVATNLVTNAREAMPNGGTIAISAHLGASGEIEIDVRDTGSGIADDHIDYVFDPLFTTKPSGMGLGLSIAYQAMQLQGGSLRVRSRIGEGSTFSMTFREATAPDTLNGGGSEQRRLRLVLVEDEEAVAEGLRALLSDEGFDVGIAANGSEAVERIAADAPDVVILDVNLPDVSGLQVYDRLHERWPDLPVIFSTGYGDARSIEGVQRRQRPWIMKPYDVDQLAKLIREEAVKHSDRERNK